MTSKVMDIANYIVEFSLERGFEINNLKLQKLLYYSEARHLSECDDSLFSSTIEKWKLGPVIPIVYHNFKKYGNSEIEETEATLEMPDDEDFLNFRFVTFDSNVLCDKIKKFLEDTVIKLQINPFRLVDYTHQEPLWKDDEKLILKGAKHLKYDRDSMIEYFKKEDTFKPWQS